MSNFGALTDHFGLAAGALVLIDSSETIIEQSRADALDENGDIAASTYYGNTTQNMREVSCTYALTSGSLSLNSAIKLGSLASSPTVVRESLQVTTSNSEFPSITISGRKNITAITLPTGKLNTWTVPVVTIFGQKRAQEIMFSTGAGCRLTSSSLECSVELTQQDNGVGEPIAFGLSGGQGTFSGEFVRVTAAPSWTIVTTNNVTRGVTQTQAPGVEQGQAAYHTGTGTGAFTIIRDNAT
jgi:hypothetical protein